MCPSEFHRFIKPCGVEQVPLERIFVYVCKVNGVSNDTAVNILVVDVDHYVLQTQFLEFFSYFLKGDGGLSVYLRGGVDQSYVHFL